MSDRHSVTHYNLNFNALVNRFCAVCGMPVGVPIGQYTDQFLLAPEKLHWCNRFRCILQDPLEEPRARKARLTGVGYRDPELLKDEVPVNPEITFHNSRNKGRNKKIYLGCQCQLSFPCERYETQHGFYLHAACWDAMCRVIGPLDAKKLNILVEAMKQVWETGYPCQPYALNEIVDMGTPKGHFIWVGDSLDLSTSSYTNIPNADQLEQGEWFIPVRTVAMPLTDPLHVPKLEALVNQCKNSVGANNRLTAEPQGRINHQQRTTTPPKPRAYPQHLPVDIGQMVLDELSANPTDVANAVDAFNWEFPNDLWKRRLPLNMIVELDGVSTDADFDWRQFFIRFSRMLSSKALGNRKRIWSSVSVIRDEFFKKLET